MDLAFVRVSCGVYYVVELYSVYCCLVSYFGNYPYQRLVFFRCDCYHMTQNDGFRMNSIYRANYRVVYYSYHGYLTGGYCCVLGHGFVVVLIYRCFDCRFCVDRGLPYRDRVDMRYHLGISFRSIHVNMRFLAF